MDEPDAPLPDLDEVRQRIQDAMRYDEPDWLERAEKLLDAHWMQAQRRKVYDATTVGGRVKAARESLGLTQAQLALKLGVSERAMSCIEGGTRNLSMPEAQKLGRILKPACSEAWLYMKTDEGGPQVALSVYYRKHSPKWWDKLQRQRQFARAKEELRERQAAARALREQLESGE